MRVARGTTIAVAALCTLPAWWSGAVAVAQDPYGDVAELHYAPGEGLPGSTITITGRCIYEGKPADNAYVFMYDEPPTRLVGYVSIPVDTNGDVHGTLLVPGSEPPGLYRLSGDCTKDDFTLGESIRAPFRITDATVTTTTTTTIPPPTTRPATTTTAAVTTVPPTTAPTTTLPPTTTPTTTVAATAPVGSDGPGTALPALAAAVTLAAGAVLLVRQRRTRH